MSYKTVLLIDGPGDGKKFALQNELHTVEVYDVGTGATSRYRLHHFRWKERTYLIGAIELANSAERSILQKIVDAKHEPLQA